MIESTILVPIYDPTGSESLRIERLVNSIISQELIPKKVIFAANHNLDFLHGLTSKLSKNVTVEIQKNSSRGAADNLNQMMPGIETKYTKIMFQDDFFSSANSLGKIMTALEESNQSWAVSGCSHYDEQEPLRSRSIVPKFSRKLISGTNSIGAPSVVAIKTENLIPFNENMVYMFDCEWYLRMKHKFGLPTIVKEPLIQIGIHGNQATHWAKNSLMEEMILTKKLHNVNFWSGICCSCKDDSVNNDQN